MNTSPLRTVGPDAFSPSQDIVQSPAFHFAKLVVDVMRMDQLVPELGDKLRTGNEIESYVGFDLGAVNGLATESVGNQKALIRRVAAKVRPSAPAGPPSTMMRS